MLQKEVIIEKLDYFYNLEDKIHLTKTNKEFINGFVIDKESDSIYIIEDFFGKKHKVFVNEIFNIEVYQEK